MDTTQWGWHNCSFWMRVMGRLMWYCIRIGHFPLKGSCRFCVTVRWIRASAYTAHVYFEMTFLYRYVFLEQLWC
jgi:hypothetical protein